MLQPNPHPEIILDDLDHIHIFQTNIRPNDMGRLEKFFEKETRIDSWSVDTEDCDAVLRVVSFCLSEADIGARVAKCGFFCEPLS